MKQLLEEAGRALEKMKWAHAPPLPVEGSASYFGQFEEWQAIAVSYPKGEEHGESYPAGFAGTMTNSRRGLVLKMPAEMAMTACLRACEALSRE